MKTKISEIEKEIYDNFIFDKINNKLDEYLSKFHNEYKEFFEDYKFTIYNDLYVDNNEYNIFKNDCKNYIKDNYKKMLCKSEEKYSYNVSLNKSILSSSFVSNGTLVLVIKRIIDYNTEIEKRMKNIDTTDNLIKVLDKDLEKILSVPVKVMFDDIVIPPKRFQQ